MFPAAALIRAAVKGATVLASAHDSALIPSPCIRSAIRQTLHATALQLTTKVSTTDIDAVHAHLTCACELGQSKMYSEGMAHGRACKHTPTSELLVAL